MKNALLILNLFICSITFSQNEVDPSNPSTLFVEESDFEMTDEQKQLFNNGIDKFNNKDNLGLLVDMSNLINQEPRCLSAYFYRGAAFYRLKEYIKAINDFSYCIDNITPKYENILLTSYALRASSYGMIKEYNKGISDLTFSINNFDKYETPEEQRFNFHLSRGSLYFQLNKKEEGCLDFKIASRSGDEFMIKSYNDNCVAVSNSAENNVSNTTSNNQGSSSTFKFVKPTLNITWVDNRKACCCCNKNMGKYEEAKFDNKESAEFQYISENLYLYHTKNNCSESTINADLDRLQIFVSNNFKTIVPFAIPSTYKLLKLYELTPDYKMGSKNVKVDIYDVLNKKCGKCKYDCNDDYDCK